MKVSELVKGEMYLYSTPERYRVQDCARVMIVCPAEMTPGLVWVDYYAPGQTHPHRKLVRSRDIRMTWAEAVVQQHIEPFHTSAKEKLEEQRIDYHLSDGPYDFRAMMGKALDIEAIGQQQEIGRLFQQMVATLAAQQTHIEMLEEKLKEQQM